MSSNNKAKDIRGMKPQELAGLIRNLREEAFNLRLQQATGQLENNQRIRIVRKELARALTLQGEAAAE